MSRNGSGTYSLPAGNPVVTNTTISSTWANTTLGDIANALSGSLAADGQTTASGNLQMGNNKIVNLDDGTDAGDAVNYAQLLAASGGTGRIVQTQVGTSGAAYSTSTSYSSTGMTVTITPTSATSKILILTHAMMWQTNAFASANSYTALFRNGTNLVSGADWTITAGQPQYSAIAITHLDSPATTSATTYAVYFRNDSGGNAAFNSGGNSGSIIALEITA
jgi:hypothetical protein